MGTPREELQRCKLVCSCGVRLDVFASASEPRAWLDAVRSGAARHNLPRVPNRVKFKAEKSALGVHLHDMAVAAGEGAPSPEGTPWETATAHSRGRRPPAHRSVREMPRGYRCGRCGADWQWRHGRLGAALQEALQRGDATLDAGLV